jgi:hypothetical protein
MTFRPTTLERAFALARTGECASVSEIKTRLQAEGYAPSQIEGPALVRQLKALCMAAQQEQETQPT